MKKICQKFVSYICLLALLTNTFAPIVVLAKPLKQNDPVVWEENIVEEEVYNVEAKIIGEITDKRTENEKHFKMSDGSVMAAIYSEKIHYLENGKYEEVDNELVEKDGRYTPKKGNPNISFSKDNSTTNALEIKNKDKILKIGLKNTKKIRANIYGNEESSNTSIFDLDLKQYNDKKLELKKGKNKLKYEEIDDGIDLVYEVEGDKVKEYIIIKNKESLQSVFEYNIDTTGLDIIQVEKNYIILKDSKTKEELFYITSSYMYDAKGEFSDGLAISIEKNTLKLEVDREWLEDEARVYPITIDPTVNTTTVQWDIKDTYIYNGDSSISWVTRRDSPVIYAGSNWWSKYNGQPLRSIVKFPVLPALSSSDQVIDATFYIKGYPQHQEGWSYPSGVVQFNIHKLKTDWVYGVSDNWASLSATSNYDSRIEDYILYSYSTSNPAPVYSADVTKMVQDWYTTGKNYGFVIKDNVEQTWKQQNVSWFYSSDIGNTANRPKITITYINQSGLEGYLNYHQQNIGRTTVYTNDFNGNLTLTHQDASTPGTRFPVSVNHVFNTADASTNIGFGNGFRLNLSQTIESTGNTTYPLAYIDEDGTKHWFKQKTGYLEDEENLGLKIYGDATEYKIQDKAGNASYFHKLDTGVNKWYLTKTKDTSNNEINITYDGTNIIKIIDGALDEVNFAYTNNLLSSITDKAGRVLTYGYTGNNLTSITYPDNLTTTYTYTANKINEVINIDNSKVKYEYYSGYNLARVSKITEYATDGTIGNSLDITYGQKVTTFTDNDGIVNNETFNNMGNLISTSNFNGDLTGDNVYGKTYTFGTAANNKNKLIADTTLIKPTSNYILNHSAEETNNTWYLSQWGSANGTCGYSTEQKYIGTRSIKCSGTALNQAPLYVQAVDVPKGKTYTFSSYIKTTNITQSNEGARLMAYYISANGQTKAVSSENINVNTDWQRYSLTINYPADATSVLRVTVLMAGTKGDAYFDGLQLEEGLIANEYNLIQNGNFNYGDTAWSRSSLATSDTTVTVNGNKMFKFNGTAAGRKNIYQSVNISGKAGDTFSFAYWFKNLGIKNYNINSVFTNIRVNVIGTDDSSNWVSELGGQNPDTNAWQMGNHIFTAPKDYQKIVIYICFYKQANNYFVDNITLFKDVSGNSYVYDNNGNLTNTKAQNKTSEIINNNANGSLLQSISTNGSNFAYEYDYNVKDRLTKAINKNTNLSYDLSYDQYGNNTGITIKNEKITPEVENGIYYIKSNLSGKAIDTTGTSPLTNNLKMYQYTYIYNANQKMVFTALDDTYYKITPNRDTNKAFTVGSDGHLVIYDYTGADNQKWQLIYHEDGSCEIVSKSNNKVITVEDDSTATGAYYTISDRTNSVSQRFTVGKEYDLNESNIESGDVYRIRNKDTGLYLDYKASDGYDKLYQETLNDSKDSQLWRVVQQDGYYKIYSLSSPIQKVIGVIGNADGDNKDIIVYSENTNIGQRWILMDNADGTFNFRTAFSSKRLLSVKDASLTAGAFINLKTPVSGDYYKFYFEKVDLYNIEEGVYNISVGDYNLGVVDDSDTANQRVQLQEKSANLTQEWQITSLKNGYYSIVPAHTLNNMSLDIAGSGTTNGTAVQINSSFPSSTAQQFEFVVNKNGTYYIKPKHVVGASSLDVTGSVIEAGTNIQLYTSNGTVAQQFKLTRIDEDTNTKIQTKVEYSEDGNYLEKSIDQRGNETSFEYNKNTGTTTSVKDSKNNTISYDYDILNRINSVSSNGVTNSYIYNNDLLRQINHNGFSYYFNYNNFNNVTNIKVNNQDLITNNYEPNNGNLLSSTYGNNDLVSFTYDNFNRLSTKVKEDKTYTYLYDNSNNLAVKKDNNNTCKYTYDLGSRLTEYKENKDYKINYKYDNRNNISKVDYKLNNLINTSTYSYDNDSKQMSYTVNNNRVIYDYDLFSRFSNKKISNFITTYEYLNIEDNKTTTLLDSITNDEETIRYVYDELGNIKEIYKSDVLENVYEYDGLNQLVLEKTYSLNQKIEYTYDLGGNILTKVYKNLSTDAIINTYSYGYDSDWKDQLISFNGKSLTYDEIGNPLTYGDITYSWINGRELSSYTDTSNELEVEYTYNDSGIRTSKVINGVEHKYYLEGSSIIYETIGEDTLYYFYDSNGSIEGFKYNEDIYYYIKNGQNDIIGIVDIEGNQLVSYEYNSWGQIVSIKDNEGNEITDQTNIGNINPFRYRSYYYDSETELYYLNSRYYNPDVGRFINADSGIDNGNILGTNLYQYGYNNPVNNYDDTGTWPKWIGAALKIATIAIASVVAVAALVVAAPAVIATASVYAGLVGISTATVAAAVNTGVVVASAAIAINAVNRSAQAITGKNQIADKLMGGNEALYDTIEQGLFIGAYVAGTYAQHANYPSSNGRTTPNSLNEQLGMKSVMSNPGGGKVVIQSLGDPRMPGFMGWQKMEQSFPGGTAHYVSNKFIPFYFDFKFK